MRKYASCFILFLSPHLNADFSNNGLIHHSVSGIRDFSTYLKFARPCLLMNTVRPACANTA